MKHDKCNLELVKTFNTQSISALARTHREVCIKGFEWLAKEGNISNLRPSPIGLYFAALWYDEKMCPLVYYVEALRRYLFREGIDNLK